MNVQSAPFTIEFWMYLTGANTNRMILANSQFDGEGFFMTINRSCCGASNNTLDLAKSGKDDQYSSVYAPGFAQNIWYHIAAVQNFSGGIPSYVQFFVNGQSQGTYSSTTNFNSSTGRSKGISRAYADMSNFQGNLDEVRIWNVALTQTEIRDNMCQKLTGSEAGLVGYWRFDETSGTTAYDSQTNVPPNNGTLK